jgi:hypothetical protein
LVENFKILNIWLDEEKDFGIVEVEDDVLGSVFCPIESHQSNYADYHIINHHNCQSYRVAKKIIHSFVTGRLSKLKESKYIRSVKISESD